MSDINSDPLPAAVPKQNNYDQLKIMLAVMKDEMFWIRKEFGDMISAFEDHTELIGRLARKIEDWVGVADE